MSLFLTHSYFLHSDAKERQIMKPYPPLGLLYISAYAKQSGIGTTVFDSTFSTLENQLEAIELASPRVVAIYTNLMTKIGVVRLIRTLKNPIYGNPVVVIGGPDVTHNVENYLDAGADFAIIGEGEQTMVELYKAVTSGSDLAAIDGIAYKIGTAVMQNQPRTKFRDLSDLPLPDRAAIDMTLYLETWKTHHGKSAMTISTQRGCPYTCKWCSTAVYGQSYRRRPPEKVALEMKMLKSTYSPDALWFVDDVFTISHKWLIAFADELRAIDAVIPFECITRAERLNAEILALLKEIGCFRIWIGAESGSQKVIDLMDRRVDIGHVSKMIGEANAMGIETGTFIMVGYPGEDSSDISRTIRYLKNARPTHFTITVAYPIKGTALYSEIENNITSADNWETSTDRQIEFKRKYRRRFYDFAVSKIVSEVEFDRALKSSGKQPARILRMKAKSIIAGLMMAITKHV